MEPATFSFAKDLIAPIVLSGFGAFLALWVKEQFGKSGEKRQLRTEELTLLCDKVDLCRTLSSEYWRNKYDDKEGRQKEIEARIIGLFHGCNEILAQAAFQQLSDKSNISKKINELRRTVTGSNFGKSNREENFDKLKDIESLGHEIQALVVAAKRK